MIDNKPTAGRIAVLESYLRDGFFRRGGLILSLTPKGVNYLNRDGASTFVMRSTVAAVVDSEEEVELLMNFSNAKVKEADELRIRHKEEYRKLFSEEG